MLRQFEVLKYDGNLLMEQIWRDLILWAQSLLNIIYSIILIHQIVLMLQKHKYTYPYKNKNPIIKHIVEWIHNA